MELGTPTTRIYNTIKKNHPPKVYPCLILSTIKKHTYSTCLRKFLRCRALLAKTPNNSAAACRIGIVTSSSRPEIFAISRQASSSIVPARRSHARLFFSGSHRRVPQAHTKACNTLCRPSCSPDKRDDG